MGFWGEVFDLSEKADTRVRAKAAVQVGVVLVVAGVVGFLLVEGFSERSSPLAMVLLYTAMMGAGMAIGSYRRLRQLRRRQAARAEARHRRAAAGTDRSDTSG